MQFIFTELVYDIALAPVGFDGYWWVGPVAQCKRGKEKKMADAERKRANDLQDKAFNFQMEQLKKLEGAFSKYLTQDIGFSPEQEGLLNSKFINELSASKATAGANVASAVRRRGSGGGDQPVGGDFVRDLSGLNASFGTARASGLRDIRLQSIMQAITNRFNAGSILSGNAATLNSPIGTFGSQSANALNQRVALGSIPGFGTMFLNSLGASLGSGLGSGATGGLGNLFSGFGSNG